MQTAYPRLLLFIWSLMLFAGCFSVPKNDSYAVDDAISLRRIYRQQIADPVTRSSALRAGLHSPDSIIRKNALYETIVDRGSAGLAEIEHLARDPDPLVQTLLLEFVKTLTDTNERLRLAREINAHAAVPSVQKKVNALLGSFNFHRLNLRLRDNPTWDHEIETIQTITLSDDSWKIVTDPAENGHEKNYFAVDFDDSSWKPIKVGGWEHQGLGAYDGIAWYRIRFTAPAKGQANAAELHFGAVDEVAWVWLNGIYVSQHDLGLDGWNIPFALDITPEIKWGEENLLVVRVSDQAQQGGIWKPVSLYLLK